MLLDIGTTQPILYMFASSFAKSSGKKTLHYFGREIGIAQPILWHLRQNFSLGLFIAKGSVCSNLVQSQRSQCLTVFHVGVSKFCFSPKMPFDSSRNPMVLFFWGGTLSKQDFMCIPVSQSHGSWSPSSGPAAPVDIPAPWGQTAEVFVAKNVGVGKISGYHRSPVTRLPRPRTGSLSFGGPKRIPSLQIMNHAPPRFWNSICDFGKTTAQLIYESKTVANHLYTM